MAGYEMNKFDALKIEVESDTGFKCYEGTPGSQVVWYGTSDQLEAFETLVNGKISTGTIAFTMDDGEKYMYSAKTEMWYEL